MFEYSSRFWEISTIMLWNRKRNLANTHFDSSYASKPTYCSSWHGSHTKDSRSCWIFARPKVLFSACHLLTISSWLPVLACSLINDCWLLVPRLGFPKPNLIFQNYSCFVALWNETYIYIYKSILLCVCKYLHYICNCKYIVKWAEGKFGQPLGKVIRLWTYYDWFMALWWVSANV